MLIINPQNIKKPSPNSPQDCSSRTAHLCVKQWLEKLPDFSFTATNYRNLNILTVFFPLIQSSESFCKIDI